MDKIKDVLKSGQRILIGDGASGTLMQERGMPSGVCPEIYAIENPEILRGIQKEYFAAGSNIIYTFTFGANRTKLENFHIPGDGVYEINKTLAKISCETRDEFKGDNPEGTYLVAGDIAPTGKFLEPAGDMGFGQLKEIYMEQAKGLLGGGVDLFVVETMMDLAQARIAVLAIKEITDLPVIVSMTFQNGKTMSGNRPVECLITLESLGVSAFGANCSEGPDEMLQTLKDLSSITDLTIMAKPNAGMPKNIEGRTVFPMGPCEFSEACEKFIEHGIGIIGGCCGTTPEHINLLSKKAGKRKTRFSKKLDSVSENSICSSRSSVQMDKQVEFATITCENPEELVDEISKASEEEPDYALIDFSTYEQKNSMDLRALEESIKDMNIITNLPLGIATNNIQILETVFETYCGKLAFASDVMTDRKIKQRAGEWGLYIIENSG